jgi:threonine 3-dehydrogenase
LTGGPVKDSTVAIHGLGPIGLFAVDVARAMGAKKIIATDWDNQTRMDLAKELGADLVLGKDDDVVAEILSATGGVGVDNSCEFSGAAPALTNAIKSTRNGGWLNILGVYGSDPVVPVNDIVFRYLHVKGINGRKMWQTWDTMQELLAEGDLNIDKVVTHRLHWHDFQAAIALMQEGNCGKVVLNFE